MDLTDYSFRRINRKRRTSKRSKGRRLLASIPTVRTNHKKMKGEKFRIEIKRRCRKRCSELPEEQMQMLALTASVSSSPPDTFLPERLHLCWHNTELALYNLPSLFHCPSQSHTRRSLDSILAVVPPHSAWSELHQTAWQIWSRCIEEATFHVPIRCIGLTQIPRDDHRAEVSFTRNSPSSSSSNNPPSSRGQDGSSSSSSPPSWRMPNIDYRPRSSSSTAQAHASWDLILGVQEALYLQMCELDDDEHTSRLDFTQSSRNSDLWPQTIYSSILHAPAFRSGFSNLSEEVGSHHILGRLVSMAISTELFPVQWRSGLEWPMRWSCDFGQPSPDFSCRLRPESIGWAPQVCPVLFAAQCDDGDRERALHTLLQAFHPMIILFILYYLDTRQSPDEPLPSWMVLYGIIYREDRLYVYTFWPSIRAEKDTMTNEVEMEWSATYFCCGDFFESVSISIPMEPETSLSLIDLLDRIQRHCLHLLERFKTWDGYWRTCSPYLKSP